MMQKGKTEDFHCFFDIKLSKDTNKCIKAVMRGAMLRACPELRVTINPILGNGGEKSPFPCGG